MSTVAIILVVVLLCIAFAGWPGTGVWQHGYGPYPSGLIGIVVLVLIILLATGRI